MSYPWAHLIDSAWERFVAKIEALDPLGCWIWTGARSRGQGNTAWYGSFNVGEGFIVRAHIFAAAAAGEATPGMHRDHFVCGNTLCANPAHLQEVTPAVNSFRRWGRAA